MKLTRKKAPVLLLVVAAIAGLAIPGRAASVAITNASFESPVVAAGSFSGVISGWTETAANEITWNPPAIYFPAVPDGHQVAALGAVGGSPTSSFSQTLTTDLAANTTYTLTFFVGNPTGGFLYSGYIASLSANGVTLVSDNTAKSPAPGDFLQDTLVYNSGASPAELGQALTITFTDTGNAGAVAFDLVQLDATATAGGGGGTAPEPGTWVMIAAGIGLIGARKRRIC